jgi:hypothetical protein
MKTQCTSGLHPLQASIQRQITARFDGGVIGSDTAGRAAQPGRTRNRRYGYASRPRHPACSRRLCLHSNGQSPLTVRDAVLAVTRENL